MPLTEIRAMDEHCNQRMGHVLEWVVCAQFRSRSLWLLVRVNAVHWNTRNDGEGHHYIINKSYPLNFLVLGSCQWKGHRPMRKYYLCILNASGNGELQWRDSFCVRPFTNLFHAGVHLKWSTPGTFWRQCCRKWSAEPKPHLMTVTPKKT